jgi:hypothetical protein
MLIETNVDHWEAIKLRLFAAKKLQVKDTDAIASVIPFPARLSVVSILRTGSET